MHLPKGLKVHHVLQQGRNFQLVSAVRTSDSTNVLLKMLIPGQSSPILCDRLRREYALGCSIDDPNVLIYEGLETVNEIPILQIRDEGAICLSTYLKQKRPSIAESLGIGLQLTSALEMIHRQGMVHKDVQPDNIMIDPKIGHVRLGGFALASQIEQEQLWSNYEELIEANPIYMAPEQTGRMNHALDYRADFYGLGIVLFEMLAGAPPFQGDHVLDLFHAHMARNPRSLLEIDGNIPRSLEQVVFKLLAKGAEDRYQSARGLREDLQQCHRVLIEGERPKDFQPGQHDIPEKFQLPHKIYGRDMEKKRLKRGLNLAREGACCSLWVGGQAGIGKSQLIQEIRKDILADSGLFFSGKCDQMAWSMPFSAMNMALRQIVRHILGESDVQIAQWRTALLHRLGVNTPFITELIPEFALIIDKSTSVEFIDAKEREMRFFEALHAFLRVCADRMQPLILFLDDVQWADASTLKLVGHLLTRKDLDFFYLIAAYRNNESVSHIQVQIQQLEEQSHHVDHFVLDTLRRDHLGGLLADALYQEKAEVSPLAEVVWEKTGGNPFYVRELLKNLVGDDSIYFDVEANRWDWNLDAIRRCDAADNVVTFMLARLGRLENDAREVLSLAACLGDEFHLSSLADILKVSIAEVAESLWESVRLGYLLPMSDLYQIAHFAEQDETEFADLTYRFQHDRIRQAAYELTPEKDRVALHLKVGLALQKVVAKDDTLKAAMIHHLNMSYHLIDDREELYQLARLNLDLAIKTRKNIAYEHALGYLEKGLASYKRSGHQDNSLRLSLACQLADVTYLLHGLEAAEVAGEEASELCSSPLEKARLDLIRMSWYMAQGDMPRVTDYGIRALRGLGEKLSKNPGPLEVALPFLSLRRKLAGQSVKSLVQRPTITEERPRLLMKMFTYTTLAAYFQGNKRLFASTIFRRVQLCFRLGNSPDGTHAYAVLGMLFSMRNLYPLAEKCGAVASLLLKRFPPDQLSGRVRFLIGFTINPWFKHWSEIDEELEEALQISFKSGDMFYAAMAASMKGVYNPSLSLDQCLAEGKRALVFLERCKVDVWKDLGRLHVRYWQLLKQGVLHDSFDGEGFQETQWLTTQRQLDTPGTLATYYTLKAVLAFFAGNHQRARSYIEQGEAHRIGTMGTPVQVQLVVMGFLAHASCHTEQKGRWKLQRTLNGYIKQMSFWAKSCPPNFLHLQLLFEAEKDRVSGKNHRSSSGYDIAIDTAMANGFLFDAALINLVTTRFYTRLGRPRLALFYLHECRRLLNEWGATTLTLQLELRYQSLLDRWRLGDEIDTRTLGTQGEALDLETVVRSSRTISQEMNYQRLLTRMMNIMVENAGAQKGHLVLNSSDGPLIEACVEVDKSTSTPSVPLSEFPDISGVVVRYVFRTGNQVILGNALLDDRFGADTHIRSERVKSLLAMPLCKGKVIHGVLYLENNLVEGTFNEDRVQLLQLVVAQAVVSLENARLFTETLRQEKEMRRLNNDLSNLNEELEERVRKRTADLERTQKVLLEHAHKAGMADLATSVLHDVGNILNSVHTSIELIRQTLDKFRLPSLQRANTVMRENMPLLQRRLEDVPRLQKLFLYYLKVEEPMLRDLEDLKRDAARLHENIEEMRKVVMEQQRHASGEVFTRVTTLDVVCEEALDKITSVLQEEEVQIIRDYGEMPQMLLQKTKLVQVLGLLLQNAIEAMKEDREGRLITLSTRLLNQLALLEIKDTGTGFPQEVAQRIFNHGFSTRSGKAGYGLHSAANAVTEMGGALSAESEGTGKGATLRIKLPLRGKQE